MTRNSDMIKYGKVCILSGKTYEANLDNFYKNPHTSDGLHPYAKPFDNFRRTTGASAQKVRELINLINK
tara:strand:- start:275 stop:481 length:207 start_codon:yes stop_codon:yes gene_type:complete